MRGSRGIGLALSALCLLPGCAGRGRPLPDVVLVTIDTLRQDRLGCYGYFRDTTPSLDAFAREATLFENAITPMATTLPAHVSLLTGARPLRHGIRGNFASFGAALRPDSGMRTLAQILAELGYETAAFVSAAPLKRPSGIAAGFALFSEPLGKERKAGETTREVLAWLDSSPRRPFFLWIHYFDPHDAYAPPAPYDTLFTTDARQLEQLEEKRFVFYEHPQIQKINNLYDGEVRYVDDQLALVLARLRELAILDEAAIVIAGDHGEGLGQHDWVGHDKIFGEQLRIPLLVKTPRSWRERARKAGTAAGEPGRRREIVGLIDVLPTLLELIGRPAPDAVRAQLDGRSLLSGSPRDYVFSQRTEGREEKLGPGREFSLTGSAWKYVHATEEADALYDLIADPYETVDVCTRDSAVAETLRGRILELLSTEVEPAREANGEELPQEHIEELKALGYVD